MKTSLCLSYRTEWRQKYDSVLVKQNPSKLPKLVVDLRPIPLIQKEEKRLCPRSRCREQSRGLDFTTGCVKETCLKAVWGDFNFMRDVYCKNKWNALQTRQTSIFKGDRLGAREENSGGAGVSWSQTFYINLYTRIACTHQWPGQR